MFVPIAFVDFTAGYDTNSAVLFPETVAVREVPTVHLGRDLLRPRGRPLPARESRRRPTRSKLTLPPDAAALLIAASSSRRDAFVLWDLIHDRTHSHGDLPFDPFMIKQRMPYWLYSLEELRCDLTAFREAVELERRAAYAVRRARAVRDPLRPALPVPDHRRPGAQLRRPRRPAAVRLAAPARRRCTGPTTGSRSTGTRVADGVLALRDARSRSSTATASTARRSAHWLAAHELVSRYVAPQPGSVWARGAAGAATRRAARRDSPTRCSPTSSR